ncbi:hypothetical protein [Nocardia seriolae]|uniref:Uncharacterized protein n=1 Tax=Nocardia seriolae TaxID=37332 RepID=A0A0B8N909_9NOCA|nr:hypothetical protein [Nocardia seriolae]APA96177.1 hypothetical protein NS506_02110 [Nocardia seriolae]MTJ65747.1 hypothetical protein [Nocardia seriolae]MTJ71603.1 hypothetical protein [Nocardia seriolae]MTJ86320.1 hypothetical protein [Nocardia seriolae]MTK30314.1 hypothetical protein [Nocardia seriolae]
MSKEIPEPPPSERRHRIAKAARNEPAARDENRDANEKLPREHDEDRSPADPHDWQDEWDRARWAP